MKTILYPFVGAGRMVLMSPALLLLFLPGSPNKQTSDPLEGIWNLHVIPTWYDHEEIIAQEREYDIATYTIQKNILKYQYFENEDQLPNPYEDEQVKSRYRKPLHSYWTRDPRYTT